jgi:uncharacterized PurR-regulated membrane protein YhhQ (DUF165 family)
MHYKTEYVTQYKYLTFMAMLSITMMIISMMFTYRVIQLGPFMAPGGVFIFALTYTVADIITEVYGLRMVTQVILSTFFLHHCFQSIMLLPHSVTYTTKCTLLRRLQCCFFS